MPSESPKVRKNKKTFAEVIYNESNWRYVMELIRERFTFGLLSYKTKRMYLLQFSLKDPWLLPKCDKHYGGDLDIVLYGWLFVYFGYADLGKKGK